MENINFDEIKTKNPKNIAVIGTGYVGLPSAAVFAKWGNNVTAVDVDVAKVQMINSGKMPIYEENVEKFIQEALANKNFIATNAKIINAIINTNENIVLNDIPTAC